MRREIVSKFGEEFPFIKNYFDTCRETIGDTLCCTGAGLDHGQ